MILENTTKIERTIDMLLGEDHAEVSIHSQVTRLSSLFTSLLGESRGVK